LEIWLDFIFTPILNYDRAGRGRSGQGQYLDSGE
jgi:hypothetical protein